MLLELIVAGLVTEYEADGQAFLAITGWHHQTIKHPTYKHPHPPSEETPTVHVRPNVNETKRNETTLNETKSTNVRTFAGVRLEINKEKTHAVAESQNEHIESIWKCNRLGPKFQAKLWAAAACVTTGTLPGLWLEGAVCGMVEQKRRSPAGWLGTVLAATALERGVDFDSFQRAIQLPEGE